MDIIWKITKNPFWGKNNGFGLCLFRSDLNQPLGSAKVSFKKKIFHTSLFSWSQVKIRSLNSVQFFFQPSFSSDPSSACSGAFVCFMCFRHQTDLSRHTQNSWSGLWHSHFESKYMCLKLINPRGPEWVFCLFYCLCAREISVLPWIPHVIPLLIPLL